MCWRLEGGGSRVEVCVVCCVLEVGRVEVCVVCCVLCVGGWKGGERERDQGKTTSCCGGLGLSCYLQCPRRRMSRTLTTPPSSRTRLGWPRLVARILSGLLICNPGRT